MARKTAALLDTLTFPFAACWQFWAHFSERTRIEPLGSGVLAELRDGYRAD
jgi:hypothetical protein